MKTLLAWSSGKDCAWALHTLRGEGAHDVVGLLTTINPVAGRIAMHAVREELLDMQAAALGLPVVKLPIPSPCSNEEYEAVMRDAMARARADGIEAIAFGDLFLEDVRRYREQNLATTGIVPLFPLWRRPTRELASEMIRAGMKARITCVDPRRLDRSFVGRVFDAAFVSELPDGVDPCGENGEFHSFAFAGPMFSRELAVVPGSIVERDGFVFADLRRAGAPPDTIPAWIPQEARVRFDFDELEMHEESALRERDRLEQRLHQHVLAYRRDAKGRPGGFCSVYASADLSSEELVCLKEAEARFPGVVFVAYARPLRCKT